MINNTVTISAKYQVVIPREIRKLIKIKPNEEVDVSVDEKRETILVKPKIKNWVKYMMNLDKETWQKIDVEKYHKEFQESFERDLWKK